MRNQYSGTCYRCGETVAPGEGHFERFAGKWRTQHAECAIRFRGIPDPAREAQKERNLRIAATKTGKKGQRARKALRGA